MIFLHLDAKPKINPSSTEMPRKLSPAQISEAKECFAIYSREGRLPTGDLGNALRSLGINPSNADIKQLITEIGSPTYVNFDTFMVINVQLP